MKRTFLLLLSAFVTLSLQAQEQNEAIHIDVHGTGNPILLIPGFTVPGEIWDPLVEKLKADYECHVITLAGFGGKPPIAFPWLPKVNNALEQYIVDHDLEDAIVIGHSIGGTIATWLASREEVHLSKLILIDALPAAGEMMFPNFDPETLVYDSPFNNQQLAMSESNFDQLATTMAMGMSLEPSAQNQIKNWMVQADRKTYVYGYTDYLKLDTRACLKEISAPVVILAAGKPYGDTMVRQTYTSQYANLADYELIIAENSAHFIMLDQPEWFAEQIQAAVASR
ncbi:MAG: alpha/beta hydrolase [Bacteroidota bacterium]